MLSVTVPSPAVLLFFYPKKYRSTHENDFFCFCVFFEGHKIALTLIFHGKYFFLFKGTIADYSQFCCPQFQK